MKWNVDQIGIGLIYNSLVIKNFEVHMKEESFTYLCRSRQCGCIFMLAVDRPGYAGDTAAFLFNAVINGLYIERIPSDKVKDIDNLLECPHEPSEKVTSTVWMCSIKDDETSDTQRIEALSPQAAAEECVQSYIADYDAFYGGENDDDCWDVLVVSEQDHRYVVTVTRHRAEGYVSSVAG